MTRPDLIGQLKKKSVSSKEKKLFPLPFKNSYFSAATVL